MLKKYPSLRGLPSLKMAIFEDTFDHITQRLETGDQGWAGEVAQRFDQQALTKALAFYNDVVRDGR